jgi:exodeoxyribonuclease VII small subunit
MSEERRDGPVSEGDDPVGDLSYMDASRELDSIVAFFEKSEVDVDQLVARLERATAIVDELDKRIRRTRAQVEELVPKLEAVGRAVESEEASLDNAFDRQSGPGAEEDEPVVRAQESEPDKDTLPF